MSNGGSRVVLNTRERIISNDHNRLQDMIGGARAAAMARLHGDVYDARTPGYAPQTTVGGQTPMLADVFGGLFVQVDDPNNLFIDPGVVGVVDPDASPGLDDEVYKVIDDPGLTTAGVLTWQANASGSIRIDVILADVVEQVLETDNRDIFDPATGLFTVQTVNKVVAKRLSYSILRGTPGAGMPVLPNQIVLAVASVPDGTASWADVGFWDCRPLVSERMHNAKITNEGNFENTRRYYEYDYHSTSGAEFSGFAYTEYGGYRVGGRLMSSIPGQGDIAFDAGDAANGSNGSSYLAPIDPSPEDDRGANPIFIIFPHGLPRWARYSEGNAPGLTIRAPYGANGILVGGRSRASITDYAKVDQNGLATGVGVPPLTGLLGTADGVCLMMLHMRPNSSGGLTQIRSQGRGRRVFFHSVNGNGSARATCDYPVTATWSAGDRVADMPVEVDWWDNGVTGVPRNARTVLLQWFEAALQTDGAFAPPNNGYNRMGYCIAQSGLEGFQKPFTEYGFGDGTSIPNYYSQILEIPMNRDSTPVVLSLILSPNTSDGSPCADNSLWEHDGTDLQMIVHGYEV